MRFVFSAVYVSRQSMILVNVSRQSMILVIFLLTNPKLVLRRRIERVPTSARPSSCVQEPKSLNSSLLQP